MAFGKDTMTASGALSAVGASAGILSRKASDVRISGFLQYSAPVRGSGYVE